MCFFVFGQQILKILAVNFGTKSDHHARTKVFHACRWTGFYNAEQYVVFYQRDQLRIYPTALLLSYLFQ